MKRTLFIGLGGCGLQTVAALSKKLADRHDSDSEFMYLYIDTDESTLDSINKSGTVIKGEDYVSIGEANPYKIYEQASLGDQPEHKRILEWATAPGPGHVTFLNQQLIDGATAQRMIGRTAFAQFATSKIKAALERRLALFQKHETNDGSAVDADIWVVSSSCGGTGSSLTLDMLYLINRLVNKSLGHNPYTKLVLFMPHAFIKANEGNINHPLNGMSFLWELNAFKQAIIDGGKDIFRHFSAYPWNFPEGIYDLCRFVIPVDTETDFNRTIDLDNIYATTAEMLYYLNVGEGARQTVSNLSNDIPMATKISADLPKYADTAFKWGRYLIPYGYHVIRKANLELTKYLKLRAVSEILSYGLLGEDIPQVEKTRNLEKSSFALKYILPYLYECQEGQEVNDLSVKTRAEDAFPSWRYNTVDIDPGKVNGFLNRVKEASESADEIRNQVYPLILQSINTGVCKVIAEHGLQYAYTLLNLVDDYYLEPLNTILQTDQKEAQDKADALLSTITSLMSKGINKKSASAIAKNAKDYREEKLKALTISISRRIIDDLTVSHTGYLEVLRKGKDDFPGIIGLIQMVGIKAGQAKTAYDSLAKAFLDSEKDALTVYLPSLSNLAGKGGNGWTKDNEFEKIYFNSILDYDHERAKGVNGIRVPIRKNENNNNLCHYIELMLQGSEPELFATLALSPRSTASFNLDSIIDTVMDVKLEEVILTEGSSSQKWINQSLDDYIAQNRAELQPLLSVLAKRDKIPVLYPKKQAATEPILTRYLYVGASRNLADSFGFVENEDKFVSDPLMTDRFQIIKMPVGLDFYSYKYFEELQSTYRKKKELILNESVGCHLHRAFRFLDLDKAVKEVKETENIQAIQLFFKNLYYQHLILEMKSAMREDYNRLFGRIDLVFGETETPTEDGGELDLSQFFGDDTSGATSTGEINLEEEERDIFFKHELKQVGKVLGMTIQMWPLETDTDGNLVVAPQAETFELGNVLTPARFCEGLVNASSSNTGVPMTSWMKRVATIESVLKQKQLSSAVDAVKTSAKRMVLTPNSKKNNIAPLLNAWIGQKAEGNRIYIEAIRNLLNNLLNKEL